VSIGKSFGQIASGSWVSELASLLQFDQDDQAAASSKQRSTSVQNFFSL
jgi:hypothetical protein